MQPSLRTSEPPHDDLPAHVLDLVRHDHAATEPQLDEFLEVLARQGAREIWHKHGTFQEHLLGVWRILAAWQQPKDVCRLGLMHSIYSNSFVRMKVFDAEHAAGRDAVRRMIGDEAERLVHLFCEIRREQLLPFGDLGVPDQGLAIARHRGGESVQVSRRDLGIFFVVTMADYAEQHFAWQDRLFGLPDGSGRRGGPHTLWPGDNRPGLWMAMNARLGLRAAACGAAPLPPVFARCTAELSSDAEREARDLYWQVVCDAGPDENAERAAQDLRRAVTLNPFIAEPHVLLAQMHLNHGRFAEAGVAARAALAILAQWGTSWDKRLSWEAWVAWSRVLLKAADERTWPEDAFGIISLGEVRRGV